MDQRRDSLADAGADRYRPWGLSAFWSEIGVGGRARTLRVVAAAYLVVITFGIAISLGPMPGGSQKALQAVLAVSVLAAVATAVLAPRLASGWAVLLLTLLAAVLISLALIFMGPAWSAYASAVIMLGASATALFFETRLAAVVIGMFAIGYGIVVFVQPGEVHPVARWLWLMLLVIGNMALLAYVIDYGQKLRRQLEQAAEAQRHDRLGRFMSPVVAKAVLDSQDEAILKPHRREIAVVFVDLRNFSRFTTEVEPEEVIEVLGDYLKTAGRVLREHEATVGQIQGDGIIAYFNDPLPCEEPARRATEMALELRPQLDALAERWKRSKQELGYGIGISLGYATLGLIGFEGHQEYGPVGTVVNLASRLCSRSLPGQLLMDERTYSRIADNFEAEPMTPMEIKGFAQPVPVVSVLGPAQPIAEEARAQVTG